jgi:hypothetical protein
VSEFCQPLQSLTQDGGGGIGGGGLSSSKEIIAENDRCALDQCGQIDTVCQTGQLHKRGLNGFV